MIKIDDVNPLDFYKDYMIAYNGVVYYCKLYPNDNFPEEKEMGIFVINTNNGCETLCSCWEANVVWSLI